MNAKNWVLAASLLCLGGPLAAETIWTGSSVTFTKAAFADATLPANQDLLTENVAFTRGDLEGLYNAVAESFYDVGSPLDTAWAFQGLNGNPGAGMTAANHGALTFTDWEPSLGGRLNLAGNILNRPGVIHLLTDDIYLDVTFTDWGTHATGGRFSYTRTSPVPLPAAGWFLLAGLGSLIPRCRRA